MTTFIRRLSVFALAAALVASVAVEPVLAQPGGTVGSSPGGTTSLSNEGAPRGGTGNVATSRVGPGGQAASTQRQRQRARQRQRVARRAPARAPAPAPVSDTGLAPR